MTKAVAKPIWTPISPTAEGASFGDFMLRVWHPAVDEFYWALLTKEGEFIVRGSAGSLDDAKAAAEDALDEDSDDDLN